MIKPFTNPAPGDWPSNLREAGSIQRRLSAKVELADQPGPVSLVAGMDVHYVRKQRFAYAGAAVYSYPQLELLEESRGYAGVDFPYVQGFLSFRELPSMLAALGELQNTPDVVLCDGHGTAHPRGLGLASHLGVVTGLATVGAAKSHLVGEFDPPSSFRGDWTPLIFRDQVKGAVLCTQEGVEPLFVSPGHRVSLPLAIGLVLNCCREFRHPEPLRRAHALAKEAAAS